MFVQDLAVSVATGTPFLNHFPVPPDKVGPVIYAQEENPVSMVQDRFLKICVSRQLNGTRGRLPKGMPLHVINNAGLDITDTSHLKELARLIELHKAKLLILDPFYLMAPGVDENSASEVIPVLKNLLRIKQKYGCAILIVHHYKKQDKQNPFGGGETGRISGTGTFGRWYESLLLIERDEEDNTVRLYSKHRLSATEPPVKVEFDMGDMGDLRYEPKVLESKTEARNFYDELKAAVEEAPGISVAALGKAFGMRTERMARSLRKSTHFRLEVQANRSPMVYLRT
jgi:AAA domain